MTRRLKRTGQFKRDVNLNQKRGKDLDKLWDVVDQLLAAAPLNSLYKPHRLKGDYAACWECHIEPDWLLIWVEDESKVMLIRTGTYADLFG